MNNQALLEEHLNGFPDAANFAALLRTSPDARVAARKCLELVKEGENRDLDEITALLESNYERVPDDWFLAALNEAAKGEIVLYYGCAYPVEVDVDGSRHLRHHGLRLASVRGRSVVARRKT